ncbi:hypothetical protein PO124_34430 [Bacillus licheniformis]|nr:hypothetical protein [Bacillus licheniformis]
MNSEELAERSTAGRFLRRLQVMPLHWAVSKRKRLDKVLESLMAGNTIIWQRRRQKLLLRPRKAEKSARSRSLKSAGIPRFT